jgi:hypothetical protein
MVAKKGKTAGQKSKGSKTAARAYTRTAAGKKKNGSKGGSKGRSPEILAPTQDPIIISGGSLMLQYANTASDGFADNGSGNGKKKLKHKKSSAGPVELTVIEIVDTAGVVPSQQIDLKALGISHHCRITVNYNL